MIKEGIYSVIVYDLLCREFDSHWVVYGDDIVPG